MALLNVVLSSTKKLEYTVDASHLIYLLSNSSTTTTTTTTINVLSSSILLNDSSLPTNVYAYFPNTLSYASLTVPGITMASGDIAHTENKMWLYYDTNNIDEWNITLSPWTATYNRRITNFSEYSAGLCAINDTKLISVDYPNVYESDITTTTSSNTLIFSTLIAGRVVSGDYMLTTTNKFIITTAIGGSVYISQYSYPSGTLEFDIDISSMSTTKAPYGLFEYNNDIYIANGDGVIYKIDKTSPFNTTLIYSGITATIYGASEIPSQITTNFSGTTTTTTTTTPSYYSWTGSTYMRSGSTSSDVCGGPYVSIDRANLTVYYTPSAALLGTYFYYNSGLTIIINGHDWWIALTNDMINWYACHIDSTGYIYDVVACSSSTTTSTTIPPTTTTTTTISPTTTTTSTTIATTNIQISNAGAGGDQIVGVSLNSVTVGSVSFPVGLGGFYVGTTTQLAGYGINVDYNVGGTRSIAFYLNGNGTHFYCTSIGTGTGTILSSPIGLSSGDTVLVLLSTAAC